jgi:hypothetical protein
MDKFSFFNQRVRVLEEPNFFIGGVGLSQLTKRSDYVNITNLGDIREMENFKIDADNNVSFYCGVSHQPHRDFLGGSEITYLIDSDDIMRTYGRYSYILKDTDNLKYIKSNFLFDNSITTYDTLNSSSLRYFESLLSGGFKYHSFLNEANSLRDIKQPNVTQITGQSFESTRYQFGDAFNLKRAYFPNYRNTGITPSILGFFFSNCNPLAKFYFHPDMGVTSRRSYAVFYKAWDIGDTIIVNGLSYECVDNITKEGDFHYENNSTFVGRNFVSVLNNDTRTGLVGKVISSFNNRDYCLIQDVVEGAAGDDTTFELDGVTTNFQHGFDEHALITFLRNRGCSIVFKDDYPLPTTPTSVSYTNLTNNSFDLNFTPSTPNLNGNDGFEVWVDCGLPWQKYFKYCEVEASGETIDLNELLNDGGTLSKLKIKIREIDGQFNLSEFSEQIELPE